MKAYSVAIAIAGFASSVAAHGYVTSPNVRMPGLGLKAACGDQVYNNEFSDHYGNVQGARQNLQGSHPDCRLWQCKGIPFSDHGEIQQYKPGQKVEMKVDIRAPHDGVANVSIVNTATDTVIGKPLISWDKYALTSQPLSQHPEWTSFDFTLPDVSFECCKEGSCVIQWFWNAASIDQTYESCVDFVMCGGSGTSNTSPSPAGGSSSAPQPSPASSMDTSGSNTSPKPNNGGYVTGYGSGSGSGSGAGSGSGSSSGSGSGSSSALPKTFTLDTFITWLRKNAGTGTANRLRRMVAAGGVHPRAFRA
ncbi:hypothetical protein ACJQWK_08541 [Exserohilum turcicum]|uniref:Chitin-binding type-4 domain-containing protein n=1 Tax=Exserohilum turcicum (strain 28A) TaxID=671987 RepID=R0KCI0_EXST2|nr:uncharacterized protein SETTUDRAFT_135655 [Exserohilum turcica Et28A]EOA87074.1 hypothetical protein SETTUDRAFT_135655 [Exserohilum turcica Et28A]